MILYVCDNNNSNIINLETFISLGGYNQLIKGYQITKKSFSKGYEQKRNVSLGVRQQKMLRTADVDPYYELRVHVLELMVGSHFLHSALEPAKDKSQKSPWTRGHYGFEYTIVAGSNPTALWQRKVCTKLITMTTRCETCNHMDCDQPPCRLTSLHYTLYRALTRTHTRTYAHIHTYAHTHTHTHTHTYTHLHTHDRTHKHTHTSLRLRSLSIKYTHNHIGIAKLLCCVI